MTFDNEEFRMKTVFISSLSLSFLYCMSTFHLMCDVFYVGPYSSSVHPMSLPP